MFFENLNAENRGNVNVLPPSMRRHQCCSFCRQPGHNITNCNSDRLREFELKCATQVLQTNTQEDFKNWLIQNYISEDLLIKTFTIKKFRITARESVEICMDMITQYIFRAYKNTNENAEIVEHENDLISFIQTFSTERQEIREDIPEIDAVRTMERMLMREMMIDIYLPRQRFDMNFYHTLAQDAFNARLTMLTNLNNGNNDNLNQKFNILSSIEHNDNEVKNKICECSICYDEKELHNFVKLGCNHEFCKDCLITTMKTSQTNGNNLSCALCRAEVKSVKSRTEQAHTEMAEFIA
jgi:hypothetical protein